MPKKAKKYAKKIRAGFIFTGEVLGQRPMSQHKGTLELIEREAQYLKEKFSALCQVNSCLKLK